MKLPQIIQGGMGIGISSWQLARAVASRGQIGIVSGTAIDLVFIRRLQDGDPGGHLRRALAAFPDQDVSRRILDRYFIEGGKADGKPYASKPMVSHKIGKDLEALLVAANFAEVFLAKEGHDGVVGINFLHKIQTPLLPSLLGAILADANLIVVGAGIPLDIPGILDDLCLGETAQQNIHVVNAKNARAHQSTFEPQRFLTGLDLPLKRPLFFPIVASTTLATMMSKKCKGKIDGFIIEGPTAGGHNAPPRGPQKLNERGEPIYGSRDEVDYAAVKKLGLPFWLAGSYGNPEKIAQALAVGASGVQIGSLFAFSQESGLRDDIKTDTLQRCHHETPDIFRDPVASPTGFPFQVLTIGGTLSEKDVYEKRCRNCDLGYLREAYEREDGALGWRCSSEPTRDYVKKGGDLENTVGRKCLCNALMANLDMGQICRDKSTELPLITCGADLSSIAEVLGPNRSSYSAADAIDYLLRTPKPQSQPSSEADLHGVAG